MNHQSEIQYLLDELDAGYDKPSWHGPNLRGAIRGLTVIEAARRPGKGRHNIWELIVHCAYWKYVVRRRVLGEKRGSFPIEGSNFFQRPSSKTERALKADIRLLDEMHGRLREMVKGLTERQLEAKPKGSRFTTRQTISGIARHDVYHAGQIQLIKKITG